MNPSRALRLSVIAFCVFLGVIVPFAFTDEDGLPAAVRDFSQSQPAPLLAMVVGVAALFGLVIGSIAMLGQKKWGAWLHLASYVTCMLAGLFFGVRVASAVSATMESLIDLVSGLIYGLAFFTDALSKGDEKPSQPLQPTPSVIE